MADYKNLTDLELLGLLNTQPHTVFNEIYNRYWDQLFLHVRRMLNDDDRAKDIVQEIFTRIWERSETFFPDTSLSAYLYTAVRNRVFNEIKHQKVKSDHLKEIAFFIEEGRYEADEQLRLNQLKSIIADEILKMPEKMREIYELSRDEYLSHKEIAEKLEISEHTVRKQIQRALKLLRNRLNLPASSLFILIYLCK